MMKRRRDAILYRERVMPTDLDELQYLARKWGADNVTVMETSRVILDPRVRFKCMIPKCYMSGGCSHCPPNGYSLEEIRGKVASHAWAVFFRVKVPPSIIAAKGLGADIAKGVMDPAGNLMNLGAHYMLTFSIVRLLQKTARRMGYAADGVFAAGNCRDALCHFQPNCRHMATGKCRHPGLSAPSMESCGMDAFSMGARAGWDVFPIGGTCGPDSVGTGSLMGLVLVGPSRPGSPAEKPGREPLSDGDPVTRPDEDFRGNFQRVVRDLSRNRAAYRQAHVSFRQAPGMARKGKTWARLAKNLHELSGSWMEVLYTLRLILTGRPKKHGGPA